MPLGQRNVQRKMPISELVLSWTKYHPSLQKQTNKNTTETEIGWITKMINNAGNKNTHINPTPTKVLDPLPKYKNRHVQYNLYRCVYISPWQ